MTHKFAKYFILAASALGLSALPALATTCGSGGGTVVVTGTVCSLGGLTFDFESVTFVPGTPVPVLELEPSSGVVGDDTVLDFQYLAENTPSDINLVYSVTSTADNITQVDSSYPAVVPNTPPASITENVCSANPLPLGCPAGDFLAEVTNSTGNPTYSGVFGPESVIYITKDVANNGFSSFTDSVVATPEPSSIGFMLIGALGIGLLSRKFRRA